MRCPKCGYENKEGVAVCNSCAVLLARADLGGLSGEEGAPAGEQIPEVKLQQTDLRAICTDPQLQIRFTTLSEQMSRNGFRQFLDYTAPQFGRANFTRASYRPDVPAYGGVVYLGDGQPVVYAELVTPFDNEATLTTTNAPWRPWAISIPPEHLLLSRPGVAVDQLLNTHRERISILTSGGTNPLPCAPEDYAGHVSRHYQESLAHATRGRTGRQVGGEGAGCATVLAALSAVGAVVALLLSR